MAKTFKTPTPTLRLLSFEKPPRQSAPSWPSPPIGDVRTRLAARLQRLTVDQLTVMEFVAIALSR